MSTPGVIYLIEMSDTTSEAYDYFYQTEQERHQLIQAEANNMADEEWHNLQNMMKA